MSYETEHKWDGVAAVDSEFLKQPTEVMWHISDCRNRYGIEVSPLAVAIALAVQSRGQNEDAHVWVSANAARVMWVLRNSSNTKVSDGR